MAERFDIAIVGAGCAGLSLAWHLLEEGIDPRRLVLIDPRTGYGRDRTWCFFEVWPNPFADLVTHRWSRWRVRADGPWVERSAPGTEYAHLPSDVFYDAVRARLESAGVELRLGVAAGAIETWPNHARVQTRGGAIDAGVVFDSRPPVMRATPGVSLLQHFEGWVVKTETPRFEAGVATLMDFAVPQDDGLHFLYVLPFDERRALVEATWFSSTVHDPEVHRAALRRALEGHEYTIEHRERGVIPMTPEPFPSRSGERVYHIGIAGGMAKPSTGYAFVDIQRYSAEMAKRLRRSDLPEPPMLRSWFARTQDTVFLQYLSRHPREARHGLVGLFEKLPAELMPRFLHDRVNTAERIAIMRAMPALRMSGEALRSARRWWRR